MPQPVWIKSGDIEPEPSGHSEKNNCYTQSLEKTLVQIKICSGGHKMKTIKLWSLIGLACLLVHIIRAEDQVI